jgi:hypothetical protein
MPSRPAQFLSPRSAILTASVVLGVLCCLTITLTTCNGDTTHHGGSGGIAGSGVIRSETRDTGAFTGVRLRNSMDVDITLGEKTRVVVEADDNLLPLIDTHVDDGVLVIDSHGAYSTRSRSIIHLQMPALREVTLDGSGDVSIDGLHAETLRLSIAGSGDISARGQVDKLDARIAGSGDLSLADLAVTDAEVRIDGSGDAELHVAGTLDAIVNGSGDVTYHGHPQHVEQHVHGSGDVRGS